MPFQISVYGMPNSCIERLDYGDETNPLVVYLMHERDVMRVVLISSSLVQSSILREYKSITTARHTQPLRV
ncbi:MAG: hypothetical protein JKX81_03745 [Arenicella sp.]|nr:hypothetical protein [Arenicella sp.]